MLAVTTWLNNIFHIDATEGVDLNTPLSYADRFRIRHPGVSWTRGVYLASVLSSRYSLGIQGSHRTSTVTLCNDLRQLSDLRSYTGGAIERWQDEKFRACFADVLLGEWRKHDPYDLKDRLYAKASLYGRPNQVSHEVFNTRKSN